MAKKIAELLIKLGADTYGFKAMSGEVKKQLAGLSKDLQGFGKSMSLYFTAPLTAAAGASVHLADVQMQAEQRLLTALKGRESVQKRLIKQAGELQSRSIFGDEVIIGQQAFLASLGLTEQQINDTIEASAQLSAATGMTLDSAVKNLAKTYGGLTGELGESIPALKQFTAEELKNGAAVQFALDNYKGFAETVARTGLGPLQQLKNSLGDLGEEIGMVLMPVVKEIVGWFQKAVTWLQELPSGTKTAIVAVGGLVAAIGPLSMGLGAILKMLPTIKSGFLAIASPIGAAALAIGTVTTAMRVLDNTIKQASLDRISKNARKFVNSGMSVDELKQMRADALAKNQQYAEDYKKALERLSPLKSESLAAYVLNYSDNKADKARANALTGVYYEKVKALDEAISYLESTISAGSGSASSLNTETEKTIGLIGQLQEKISQLEDAKKKATNTYEIANLNKELEQTRLKLEGLQNTGQLGSIVKNRNGLMDKPITPLQFDPNAINPPAADWEAAAEKFRQNLGNMKNTVQGAIMDYGTMLKNLVQDLAFAFGEGLGNILSGDGAFDDLAAGFGRAVGQFLVSLGKQLIATSEVIESIKVALNSIWATPWVGLVVGAAAIAAGTAMISAFKSNASKGIALANGGLAYGPTMALVGDNRGAGSDPEVIAPLSKLRQYGFGRQSLEFVGGQFRVSGSDLLLSIRREDVKIGYVNAGV